MCEHGFGQEQFHEEEHGEKMGSIIFNDRLSFKLKLMFKQ